MLMSFNDFNHKHYFRMKATLNKKFLQTLATWSLSDVEFCLGNWLFSSGLGIPNLHPTEGTHWVACNNQITSIQMVSLLKNYLGFLLWNEKDIIYILNTQFNV